MKTIKRIIGTTMTWIILLLFVAVIGSVVTSKLSGGEPSFYGYQFKTVLSGSMEPGIKTGSIIAIQPDVDTASFRVGDVITFREQDNRLVTHRITEVVKSELNDQIMYYTKGDNNDAADSNPVLPTNIIGKYTGFTVPYAGYAASFAGSKAGNLTLMVLPGFLLLIYAIYSLWKAISQLEPKSTSPKENLSE